MKSFEDRREARRNRLEEKWERIEEKVEKQEGLRKEVPPIIVDPEEFKKYNYEVKIQMQPRPCMHDACEGCKNGTCSGVHMISCPCPKCSPYC